MAEKYGTIPKRFTKAWWEYFWNYYKWYVIVPLVLIVIIAGGFYNRWKMAQYDLTLTYAGPHYFQGNHVEEIQDEFAEKCIDVNEDGKKLLSLAQITIATSDNDLEYTSAMLTSLQFELYEDGAYIFIIHKDFAPRFFGQKESSCAYIPVEDWLSVDVGDAHMLSSHDKNYGVSLKGSKLMEKWNVDLTDHYLFISRAPKDKDELSVHNAAIELANRFLSE